MVYIKLVIAVSDKYQESLIAELLEMDFDTFEQKDDHIITYVQKERFSVVNRERIEELLAVYPGDGYIQSEEVVADQNWNEQWEQTIQPQQVGIFFIKPTWARQEAPENTVLLEIDPKMAFGTGYHETTRLMLKLLPDVVNQGISVLDAGTGTGILSIAAIKLGAKEAFAFDIDQWSVTNTKENILLNEVANQVEVTKGSVEVVPEGTAYDLVLANIERNTILGMLPKLVDVLKEGGHLLLSGLLESDRSAIMTQTEDYPLRLTHSGQEDEWIAMQFTYSAS